MYLSYRFITIVGVGTFIMIAVISLQAAVKGMEAMQLNYRYTLENVNGQDLDRDGIADRLDDSDGDGIPDMYDSKPFKAIDKVIGVLFQ